MRWSDDLYGYTVGDEREDLSFDIRDSSSAMPKSIVVDPAFTWQDDHPPRTPWNQTVIYETHVRGMTERAPGRGAEPSWHLPRLRLGPGHRPSA